MNEYQAGTAYISESGCTRIKIKSANASMCAAEIYEWDFEAESFILQEIALLSPDDITDILEDDDFDPDGGEAQIIFTSEF